MATTLEEVAAYLKRDGRRFLWEVDGEQLLCHAAGANNRYEVEIRLSEEGECLHLRVPRVAALGQSPHAGILCARILELHFQIKLGRFGLDPLDGEIDCEIVIPLDDATLTYRQLRRALGRWSCWSISRSRGLRRFWRPARIRATTMWKRSTTSSINWPPRWA